MSRRGFTLIEFLVVAGIVAVLAALLLPAVECARDEARRKACINNLKSLGLAMHYYHDSHAVFPPGWISNEGTAGTGPKFGWSLSILPFIDEPRLFQKFDGKFGNRLPDPDDVTRTVVKAYRGPADATTGDVNARRGGYGTSNYAGNYGSVAPPRWLPLGAADAWPGSVDAPMTSNGIFARDSRVRMRDITDGTTNTILAGERGASSGAGIWPGVTDNAHEDDVLASGSHLARINSGPSAYSSAHEGGAGFLMCDGAVRFLPAAIESRPGPELGTWQKLTNKADGEPIGEF